MPAKTLLLLASCASALHFAPRAAALRTPPHPPAQMMAVAQASKYTLPEPPLPPSSKALWEVHKFGGASLATADLYKECSDLLIAESKRSVEKLGTCTPTMAIVSAKGGVTDRLIAVVNAAKDDMVESSALLRAVADEQIEVVRQLAGADIADRVEKQIRQDEEDITNVVRAVGLLRTIPPSTMELVTGYGEVWSAMTMHAYLESTGVVTAWLDARDVLVVEQTGFGLGDKGSSNTVGTDPLWEQTATRVSSWFAEAGHLTTSDCEVAAPIVVVTGFVAATLEGTPTTLKRSGSDYSATIFARLMGASRITMWKNVNGVYTADPRRVPEAFPIESLKYDEAIELAYFGAQVLHPSAMQPCIEGKIPIYVRNVFNPSHPGTVIEGRALGLFDSSEVWRKANANVEVKRVADQLRLTGDESPIRGITSVDNVAIVTVDGTGTSAVPDLASRLFSTMQKTDVQVLMVTQASADSSVCIVVEEALADRAVMGLEEAFERELAKGLVAGVSVEKGHSVVAIIGEGMAFRPGTGATFTKAMANAGVNMRCISQGSSERQISIVVERSDCTKALRAAHAALALSNTCLSLVVLGATGTVGKEFMQQLGESQRVVEAADQFGKRKALDDLRLDFKVTGVARSGSMRLNYDGLEVVAAEGEDLLDPSNECVEDVDLQKLTNFLKTDFNGNRVVVDCTASQEVAEMYPTWLNQGIHVVTANKRAGSGSLELYEACRRASRSTAQWYYETTGPGSGLPVLTTLKDMSQSGDRVYKVEGIFSGTCNYLIKSVLDGKKLSQALLDAFELGLCEPDPRDDLNGVDCRRKTAVLARELDQSIEVEDISCSPLMPEALRAWEPDASSAEPIHIQLSKALEAYDDEVAQQLTAKVGEGLTPIQLASVNVEERTASIDLTFVESDKFIARCKNNENLVEITSRRYSTSPMVLQGPGAGPEITASGLFADLLALSRTLVEWNIPKID